MAVHIDEISVQNLGPFPSFSIKLGAVNLIYGRNESGKTYLVEFIIRSLFKTHLVWNLRQAYGSGRILMTGLAEGPVVFTPASTPKLDEYWQREDRILPTNLSRLLVIKAGEVWLAQGDPAGVDHKVLKEFLSSSVVIDKIRAEILATTRNAKISKNEIVGENRGDIKRRNEAKEELDEIERRFEHLNQEYASGDLASLRRKLHIIQEELDAEWRARRGTAFRLDQELQQLDKEIIELPIEEIEIIHDEIHDFRNQKENADRVLKKLQEYKSRSNQYSWLDTAVREYEIKAAAVKIKSSRVLPGAIVLVGFLASVFIYRGDSFWAVLAILALLGLGLVYHHQMNALVKHAAEIKDLEKIAAEYEKRIGDRLRDVATLKATRAEQKRNAEFADERENDLVQIQAEMSRLESSISSRIFQLTGESIPPERWEETIRALKKRLKNLEEHRTEKNLELTRLGVSPQDYLKEAVDCQHDEENYVRLQEAYKNLESQIFEMQQRLDSLKHSLAGFLQKDINTDWKTLIEKLQDKHQESVQRYRAITAKVLAGILVNQELERLAQEEDERIRKGLRSPNVLAPLKQITRHYDQIEMENGQLLVSGSHGSYWLSDLSTGTQEQVLLSLRMGFAARHLGREQMFLIMDDAFQHADWQRRQFLVELVDDLASSGWQILYLTMDDHIRDLFRKKFGERLVYQEMGGSP